MFIVRVIPISKGIFRDELSFFSRTAFEAGSVVMAPIRGKNTPVLVVSCREAREERADIRSADFTLKKISAENGKRVFSDAFLRAAEDTALWHGTSEGAVFASLTSQVILGSAGKLAEAPAGTSGAGGPRADLLVLQAEKAERIRTYRNLAREAFARGASVLIVAPTVIEAETLARELERGIEERTVLLTHDLTKKKLLAAWNRCASEPGPLLIVGTALALSAPRAGLDAIVIERESARAYRGIHRPYLDTRRAAEALAKRLRIRFVLADFPLRVETRYRADSGEMEELARAQMRSSGNAEVVVIDTRRKDETKETSKGRLPSQTGVKRVFKTLSDETLKAIGTELARGGRVVVFAARRGIAPLTVCNDCGTPVTDVETGTPMVLHKSAEGNVFLSHRSGAILPAETPCRLCGGWNLVTLGIGVERVFDELKKAFPDAPAFLFTKDTAPAHVNAKKLSERFFSEKGALMVGTERMLPYLTEPTELVVVASVDSFLSLSAWRAHEHTLSILFYLREHADLSLIIETRKPDSIVMKSIESGNPSDFYRSDAEERERYHYPPFSTFVGLVAHGSRQSVEKDRLAIAESFKDDDLVGPLPAVLAAKNEWSARAVIRVGKGAWPDEALSERLRALPPGVSVAIDPDEIA